MPEAVIVATARSPIGRANKGSLVAMRPDDMSVQIVEALMKKVPQVQGADIDDVMMGIGQPAGEGGFNIARVVAVLAGLDDVPGVTVNRYCSSSLQTIRMAYHAIKAGEGDCFISAGVETVSRYASGASDTAPNPVFKPSGERTKLRAQGGQGTWTPPAGLPDMYIAMGQTAENVVEAEGVTREEMDRFGVRSQNLACEFDRERVLRERDHTDDARRRHGRQQGRRPAAGHQLRDRQPVEAGVPSRRHDHGRQRLPAQRRRRRGDGDERHQGQAVGHHAAGADRRLGRHRAQSRDHGPRPDRSLSQGAGAGRHDHRQIDLVEINEAFAAQVIPSAKHLGIPMEKLNVHGGAIALGHPFGMTGARIMTTLINGLQYEDKTYGLESMCVGGGQGMAMIVERLS